MARACSLFMTPRIREHGRSERASPRMTIEPDVAAPPASGAKKDLPLGYAFAAVGALLFSTKGIIVKLAYGYDVSPETLIALRAVFSLPFYLAIGAFALIHLRLAGAALPSARLIGQAMLVGVFGVWFASYTDFIGLTLISAQFERLILFTYPLFVVLFGAMFFGQRIRARALAALAVSYVGLAMIFTEHLVLEGEAIVIGVALVICSAILVHEWHATEAHFHFFVTVMALTLYEDWVPLGVSLAFVIVYQAVVGVGHGGDPWVWAAASNAFTVAAAAVHRRTCAGRMACRRCVRS